VFVVPDHFPAPRRHPSRRAQVRAPQSLTEKES
jgi:hypothetical protein